MSTTSMPSGQPLEQQPGEYRGSAPSHLVTWQIKRIPPPSPLYVDVDDQLQVGAASSQFNEVVTVNYRLLRAADGVIMRGQFTIAPGDNRAVVVGRQQLAEGFLLSVSCKAAVATSRGQTFVRLFIGAGPYGAGEPSYMLMSDYVTTSMAPAFPNGRQVSPVEGPGNVLSQFLAQPPAGSEWILTVPANARWRLVCGTTMFVTSAAVADRYPELVIQAAADGLSYEWQVFAAASPLQASSTWTVNIGDQFYPRVVGTAQTLWPIPPGVILRGTWSLASITTSIQAGDQWSRVHIIVEEWLDNV